MEDIRNMFVNIAEAFLSLNKQACEKKQSFNKKRRKRNWAFRKLQFLFFSSFLYDMILESEDVKGQK